MLKQYNLKSAAGEAVDNVMQRTQLNPEKVGVQKSAGPKTYTVKNQSLTEAILGKESENVQQSIKVPSLMERK